MVNNWVVAVFANISKFGGEGAPAHPTRKCPALACLALGVGVGCQVGRFVPIYCSKNDFEQIFDQKWGLC